MDNLSNFGNIYSYLWIYLLLGVGSSGDSASIHAMMTPAVKDNESRFLIGYFLIGQTHTLN